jgi:hypothetical protein
MNDCFNAAHIVLFSKRTRCLALVSFRIVGGISADERGLVSLMESDFFIYYSIHDRLH